MFLFPPVFRMATTLCLAAGAVAFTHLSSQAEAAQLGLCTPSQKRALPPLVKHFVEQQTGANRQLLISNQLAGFDCEKAISLPVTEDDVVWMGITKQLLPAQIVRGLEIQGTGNFKSREFALSEVTPRQVEPEPKSTPTGTRPLKKIVPELTQNLMPFVQTAVTGDEPRRVKILESNDSTIRFSCEPGKGTAAVSLVPTMGLVFSDAYRMAAQVSGKGTFKVSTLGFVGQQGKAAVNAAPPLTLNASGQPTEVLLPLTNHVLTLNNGWTIHCPNEGKSSLSIEKMTLKPTTQSLANHVRMGTWVWQAADWMDRPDKVFETAKRLGMKELYVTVPLSSAGISDKSGNQSFRITREELLRDFAVGASKRNMDVWAVFADPHFVIKREQPKLLGRVDAINAYNKKSAPEARIKGIQLDVEPYIMPGYALNPKAGNQGYIDIVKAVARRSEVPLDIVLPFWFHDRTNPQDVKVLDAVAKDIDSLTVMDYVTDPVQIMERMVPSLEWGRRAGKRVNLALELGELPDEYLVRFGPAEDKGNLWLVPVQDKWAVLYLKKEAKNPNGLTLKQWNPQPITLSASRITFKKNKMSLETMLPMLVQNLSAWPSFGGVVLHHYRELDDFNLNLATAREP